MAALKRYEFTVEGRFDFPIDMLRYDACWPKAESPDSIRIAETFIARGARRQEPKRVTLKSHKPPTEGRWDSFGWKVVDQHEIKI